MSTLAFPALAVGSFTIEPPGKPTCVFQCEKGWPNKRRMTGIMHPLRIPALSLLMVLFPNLVPWAERGGGM